MCLGWLEPAVASSVARRPLEATRRFLCVIQSLLLIVAVLTAALLLEPVPDWKRAVTLGSAWSRPYVEVDQNARTAQVYEVEEELFRGRSEYQTIRVLHTEFHGRMLLLDEDVMLTERDEGVYHEMLAHVPLAYLPNASRVLIIGGGDGGSLTQVLRHPNVENVTMVELDQEVVRTARRFFPDLTRGLRDPRATVLFEDGAAWVADAVGGTRPSPPQPVVSWLPEAPAPPSRLQRLAHLLFPVFHGTAVALAEALKTMPPRWLARVAAVLDLTPDGALEPLGGVDRNDDKHPPRASLLAAAMEAQRSHAHGEDVAEFASETSSSGGPLPSSFMRPRRGHRHVDLALLSALARTAPHDVPSLRRKLRESGAWNSVPSFHDHRGSAAGASASGGAEGLDECVEDDELRGGGRPRRPVEPYDVILVDSTDFGVARELFTNRFYLHLSKLLKRGGILAFNVDSPAWALPVVGAVTRLLRRIFRHAYLYHAPIPTFGSGQFAFVMASDSVHPWHTPVDWDAFLAKNLSMRHYTPAVHLASFATPRLTGLAARTALNERDLASALRHVPPAPREDPDKVFASPASGCVEDDEDDEEGEEGDEEEDERGEEGQWNTV